MEGGYAADHAQMAATVERGQAKGESHRYTRMTGSCFCLRQNRSCNYVAPALLVTFGAKSNASAAWQSRDVREAIPYATYVDNHPFPNGRIVIRPYEIIS